MSGCKARPPGGGTKLLNHIFRWDMNPRLLTFLFFLIGGEWTES